MPADAEQILQPAGNLRPIVTRILVISATAFAFLLWILFFRTRAVEPDPDALSFLPAVNASLNGLSALCVTIGYFAIRAKKRRLHITLMLTAIVLSVVFLASYITYHTIHGSTTLVTEGFVRYFYFAVLGSHIACTAFALPLIMTTVVCAATKRFELHKRIARYTIPLWLYVSLTGVAIYFLLKANS